MKETGCHAVKCEGGERSAKQIKRIVRAGIPVMAHIGFTPQSEHGLGGHIIQGRGDAVHQLLCDAHAVEDAGAFAVVLEMVPSAAAERVTKELEIPTISVGAGPHCDGQLLVWSDWAGFTRGRIPKFVKQYARIGDTLLDAAKAFREDVESGRVPGAGARILASDDGGPDRRSRRSTPDGRRPRAIDEACRDVGFFQIVGHGIDPDVEQRGVGRRPRVLRAAARRQAGDGDPARRRLRVRAVQDRAPGGEPRRGDAARPEGDVLGRAVRASAAGLDRSGGGVRLLAEPVAVAAAGDGARLPRLLRRDGRSRRHG